MIKNFLKRQSDTFSTKKFHFSTNRKNLKEYIRINQNFNGKLLDLFTSENNSFYINKWHHYLPIYEKYFSNYLNRGINFLEIGVADGGSLEMWSNYFSSNSNIFGIDINKDCKNFETQNIHILIGDATDKNYLKNNLFSQVDEFDIILDDGSHKMKDILNSFEHLYPKLKIGGLYVIEDLHTSSWPKFGGGLNNKNNFFNMVRKIIDDMHFDFHNKKTFNSVVEETGYALHIYNSILIIEKKNKTDLKFSNTKFLK